MSRHIETTIDIDATPEIVWQDLTDFPSHAEWNPFFASVEGRAEVGARLRVTARKPDGSAGISFKPEVLEAEPGHILRWKGKLLFPGVFDGTHYFRLEPLSDGRTRLHHGEHFSGILVPLMGKVLADTEKGFEAFNSALAERAATGRPR